MKIKFGWPANNACKLYSHFEFHICRNVSPVLISYIIVLLNAHYYIGFKGIPNECINQFVYIYKYSIHLFKLSVKTIDIEILFLCL